MVEPETTSDDEILAMHKAGVRGVRINLYHYRAMADVELQKVALSAHAERIKKLSLPWSLTMTTMYPEFWGELQPFVENTISRDGIPLITDHFALLKGSSMLLAEYRGDPSSQPGFEPIMSLVRTGKLFVKLSAPYRVSELKPDYSDLKILVRAFVDANPNQVLWGSDWPHTPRMKVRTQEEAMTETPFMDVDDEAWLQSLRSWLSDEEWDKVMVQNPSRLFQ